MLGAALVMLSAPVLIPLLYEHLAWKWAAQRYAVSQIFSSEARVDGHSLVLQDAVTGFSEQYGKVTTLADGRDVSVPWTVRIRPQYSGGNRYFLWAALASWQDLETGERRIVAVQSNNAELRKDRRYRLLFVDGNGIVTEEVFSYDDRANPSYRVLLASYVSGAAMNFRFAWAYGLPTVWFPLGYPLLSGIIGVFLVCAGIVIELRKCA